MSATATKRSVSAAGPTLVETISSMCVEFRNVKTELQRAMREVWALRRELNGWYSRYQRVNQFDLAALRRRVAFQNHPDRGGDSELMSTLNAFFDAIEGCQQPASTDATERG